MNVDSTLTFTLTVTWKGVSTMLFDSDCDFEIDFDSDFNSDFDNDVDSDFDFNVDVEFDF